MERVFADHFTVTDQTVTLIPGKDLSASSLQSPDDLEATFREKRGTGHVGYVSNVTETCAPDNPLQLVLKVQTAPNSTDDSQLLVEALPNLTQRTALQTMYTDGGHGGPQADQVLQAAGVEHLQTAIRGTHPDPNRLHLSDFDVQLDEQGQPRQLRCPHGQQVVPHLTSRQKGYVAHFVLAVCQECPLAEQCPTRTQKRVARRSLLFTARQALVARRRRFSLQLAQGGSNPRAAVEATIRCVKHPFRAGKLPVRGRFRMACLVIGSAAMVNIRRIQRYLAGKNKDPKNGKMQAGTVADRVFRFCQAVWKGLAGRFWRPSPVFGF